MSAPLWYNVLVGERIMQYQKLKQIRRKKDLSSQKVASGVGISSAYYCQIENGKRRLTYAIAVRIADYFEMKPDDIFYEDAKNNLTP